MHQAEGNPNKNIENRPTHNRPIEYKVVEVQTVADDMIEHVLNKWTRKGWDFEGLHFVANEASKRPKMAFVIFTRAMTEANAKTSGES